MTTTTDNNKTEMVSISLDVYPNWTGNRVARAFKFPKQDFKLEGNFPIPANSNEAMACYGVDIATLVTLGVQKLTYDRDGLIPKMVQDTNIDVESTDETDLLHIGRFIEAEISTPPAPKKNVEAKADRVLGHKLRKSGKTQAEIDEFLAS